MILQLHNGSRAHERPNQRMKVMASVHGAQKYERRTRKSRQKKSSAETRALCLGRSCRCAAAVILSSPIDGQMSPRPLMASVIRSAQRHQHKSMLLLRCSINNKITRASRFFSTPPLCRPRQITSAVQKRNPLPRPSILSALKATDRLICARPLWVFDAPLLVKWAKIECHAANSFRFIKMHPLPHTQWYVGGLHAGELLCNLALVHPAAFMTFDIPNYY